MTEGIVQPQWSGLDTDVLRNTVVIVGASDTGKSTLARYLFKQMSSRGLLAAYLDADVGQGTLGLPTTMSRALASGPGDVRFPPRGPSAACFVGATTPRGHVLPTLVGAYRLQQRAEKLGADVVIVDTTGFVDSSQGGQALKQWKIELLAPATIVALQRSGELEPVLWPLRRNGRAATSRFLCHPAWSCTPARHLSPADGTAYLATSQEVIRTMFRCTGWPRTILSGWSLGALMAFQDGEGYAVALGVVQEIRYPDGSRIARTPISALDRVSSLRFGPTRCDQQAEREISR